MTTRPRLRLEVIEADEGFFTVICGDRFADMLARDEALGVVAAALFGSGRLPYLQTYEQWARWQSQFRSAGPVVIAGLLTGPAR